MQRLRSARLVLSGVIAASLAAATAPAYADVPVGEGSSDGGLKKNALYARASKVTYDTSKNGSGSSTGPLTVSGGNWSPPPCWYAPLWDPKQFEKENEESYKEVANDAKQPSYAKRSVAEVRQMYKDGEYKDYNKAKEGKGMWWGVVENPNEPDVQKRLSCNNKPPFWVDNGKTPPVEKAIDPEVLAGLAYQQLKVPDTAIDLSPKGRQTVNLATWAWLDKATFKPVSVTASVGAPLDISATTTATPVSLKLEPGTKDAELHPASGECPIDEDGSIGTPYTKGSGDKTPPCGLTYLRSTPGGGAFKLKATITWKVEWTGTGGAGDELPDGVFGTTQDVTVREVQAINR